MVVIDRLVFQVINLYAKGIDIEKLSSYDEKLLLKYDINPEDIKELTSVIKRFNFFKDNGFIKEFKTNETNFKITEEVVSEVIANTNDITFEVTDNCNLNCKYCGYGEFYGSFDKRENKPLPFSYVKNTIDYIFNHIKNNGNYGKQKIFNISFYGGEPLLKIELIKKIIDYLESLSTPFTFDYSMTTNGILLGKHIAYLIEKKFDLAISLDGNEQHNSYRVYKDGTSSFSKVLSNLQQIEINYPDFYAKHITIFTVLHNKNSIIESTNFCNSNINKTPVFSPLSTSRVLPNKKKDFSELYSSITDEFKKAHNCSKLNQYAALRGNPFYQSFKSAIANISNYGYFNYCDFFLNQKRTMPTSTCLPFQKSIFITVNGKLLPCESVGQSYAYGSVNEKGCNLNFSEIANSFNNYINKYAKQCSTCYSFDDCPVCVFDLLNNENNEVCDNYTNYESYKKYLTEVICQIESINSGKILI
jgi:uncharacterized protein